MSNGLPNILKSPRVCHVLEFVTKSFVEKSTLQSRVAQNLEILEAFTSLGGSIFHFGYMKRKKYFLKILFIFATHLAAPIFPIMNQWAILVERALAPK